MNNEIENYIKTISNHIIWKNYRSAINTELQNHINDSISSFVKQGMAEEDAITLSLENMGDPDILGKQLNAAYKPDYDKKLLLVTFVSILIFSLFEYFAIIEITGNYLYILKIFFRILLGSLSAFLLFISDWSTYKKLNRFALKVFIIITLFYISSNFIPFSNNADIVNGTLLLYPLLCCCFLDRIKDKKVPGFFLAMTIFIIPILISYYMQSFSSMIMLSVNAWIILMLIIKNNWFDLNKKMPFYVSASVPYLYILIYSIRIKLDNILLNMKGFFIWDIIKKSKIFGKGTYNITNNERIMDYPIALMIANYGYIILLIYILFFAFILFKVIQIYDGQQNFLAKLFLMSILISFATEFGFSLLLNLGVPLVKGLRVPFLDLNFGIVIKIIQLGFIEKLDCFGNYIFSNYSHNKLFDIEDGKIIIFYK